MLTRRRFFQGLGAVAVAAPVAAKALSQPAPVVDASPYLTPKDTWFLKTDHDVPTYKRTGNRLMTAAEMRRILEPGLNAAFESVYGK